MRSADGAVANAGRIVREFTRVLKDKVEEKAGITMETQSNLVQWMVRWAAMITSRFLMGKDGLTGYERRRGRKNEIKH